MVDEVFDAMIFEVWVKKTINLLSNPIVQSIELRGVF